MEPQSQKQPPPSTPNATNNNNSSTTLSSTLAIEICNKIAAVFSAQTASAAPQPLSILINEITSITTHGGAIFVYGVGREGLMLKALCMRLSHLGLRTHCVFDMTTPPIGPKDLLLASAGPGGFSTVDAICGVAKRSGARVVVLTAKPEFIVRENVSAVAYLPAKTMADGEGKESDDVLPMGSLYEGALFVLFEMVVWKLGEVLGESAEVVRSRHTNLE